MARAPREESGQGFLIRKQRVLKVSWAAAGAPGKEPGRPKNHVDLLETMVFVSFLSRRARPREGAGAAKKQCFPIRKQWFLKVSGDVARAPGEEPGRPHTMFSYSKTMVFEGS